MKKSTALLIFSALALAAIGVFVFTPEPVAPRRATAAGATASSGTAESRATALDQAGDWTATDRSSAPERSAIPVRPAVGSVFAPPQTSRTGSFSPAASPAPKGEGPLLPVGGQVLGDATGFEVDPGVAIPAVLATVAPEAGLSEQQLALSQQIAAEFARKVDRSPEPSAAWPAERTRADNRYRLLFGEDLYRQHSLKVAREARGVGQP